jgi:GDP-4-dehydro-6-deoxy-D-mannose reductase
MRVLITGAAGFVGRHAVELCAERGAEVVALGRRSPDRPGVPEPVDAYLQVDLREPERAATAIADALPDRLFHLAALASVARSWEDPLAALRDNYLITANVLEAVRIHRPECAVLIACSGEQYGLPERLPVDEDAPLRPRSPYAAGKAAADMLAGFYADAHGLRVFRTRAFNHAGPGQAATYVASGIARQIASAERSGAEEVTVTTGNVKVRRDFLDVRDVVRAYWSTLEHAEPGVYNVCSGRATAVADILAAFAQQTALKVDQRTDPRLLRRNEVMEVFGSNEKLTHATPWTPEYDLSRTLGDSLEWWRAELA